MKSFPPYRLDLTNQCLWREDARISLAPKVFSVLEYLVRHAGRLVSQEELLEAVWPETYVQPEVLRKYVLEIRKALDDPAKDPRFVETLPKRGYRFIAGVHDETTAHRASGPAAPPPSAKLVGREAVLGELAGYLQESARGHRQLVFVTGEPGIGKTSLVDSFAQHESVDRSIRIVRGQCVEGFGGKEAYYPVLEAFGLLMQSPDRDDVVRNLVAQAPTWFIQFPSIIKAEQRERLHRELLGATRERMVREICDALETLTADRLLVLILEDLQWVDNPTLDLISALARRRAPAKLMLLATYRPLDVILSHSPLRLLEQDLLVHHLCHEISLTRLSEADIERYLAREYPSSSIGKSLSAPIHQHSDGNPLFMLAILDRLVQTGVIARVGDRWTVAAPPKNLRLEIPETLQQMLETQLAGLGAAEQQFLRAASVAGGRFSAWAASALLDLDIAQVEEFFEKMVADQHFLKHGTTPDSSNGSSSPDYEFKHILYREVLYRQLKPAQRRRLHLRLAERMEALPTAGDPALASELAFHFEEGEDYGKAVRYLILTATNAMRRYAPGDAIRLLHHALDLLPRIALDSGRELEIEILERISDSLYAQGEMLESADVDRRAAELAAQRGLKAAQVHALTREARALAFLDPGRCIAVCDRAAEVSRTQDDALLQARAALLAACWHIVTNGWSQKDAEICAAARARLRQLSPELAVYYEILYAHVQCIEGDYSEALHTAQTGIPKAVEDGSLVVYLSAHSSLAHALLHLGRWGELLRVLASARDVAEKNRNAPWLGIFQASLAWLHFHACDFEGARRLAGDLLKTHVEEPAGQIRTMATITAAFADIELGAADQALPALAGVCERPEYPRFFMDWYWRTMARLGLSHAWLRKNDSEEAGREADLFLQSAMSGADPNLKALAFETKARVAMNQPQQARQHLDAAFAALANVEIPSAAWRVHACAARLNARSGDGPQAEHHRQRAATILRQLSLSFPEPSPLQASLIHASQSHPLLNLT